MLVEAILAKWLHVSYKHLECQNPLFPKRENCQCRSWPKSSIWMWPSFTFFCRWADAMVLTTGQGPWGCLSFSGSLTLCPDVPTEGPQNLCAPESLHSSLLTARDSRTSFVINDSTSLSGSYLSSSFCELKSHLEPRKRQWRAWGIGQSEKQQQQICCHHVHLYSISQLPVHFYILNPMS